MLRLSVLILAALAVCQALPRRLQPDVDVNPQIVGGTEVDIKDFSYQISFMFWGDHSCGGSILNSKYILTAGHCVDALSSAREATIRAGSTSNLSGGTVKKVSKAISHPKFNIDSMVYDVALLKLKWKLKLTSSAPMAPTRLVAAGTELAEGTNVIVSGWGTLHSQDPNLPTHLMAVTVPIVSRESCKAAYSQRGYLVDETMICAGVGGKDSCQGDSGGPLVDENKTQVGVVSWGIGCASPSYPGVYANLAHAEVRSWIVKKAGMK